MQPGKDSDNAAFSCGSGVLYRRKALLEVGGFSTWNLVEDLHTSILLHARGWKSVYHNYPLTRGTAPTDIWGVYKQRSQWAMDSLRILLWDNPFKRRGLSFIQKFQYAHVGWVYLFAGFAMPLFYVIPIFSLYAGEAVILSPFSIYMLYRMPSLLLTACAYKAATEPTANYRRAINTWLGYFPCFIYGAVNALRSRRRKPGYQVNGKSWRPINGLSKLTAIAPQLLLVLLSLVGIPYGFVHQTGNVDLLLISSFWALMTVEKLYPICVAPFSVKLSTVASFDPLKGLGEPKKFNRAA
jgi:cellulose synthase (UDP-forming)